MRVVPARFFERERPRRRWLVTWLAIAVWLPAAFLGTAALGQLGLLLASVAVFLLGGWTAKLVGGTPTPTDGIELAEGGVVVGGATFAASSVTAGYAEPGRGVVLDLADGSVLTLGVGDGDAETVLAHLGVGAEQRTLRMPLRGTIGAFTMGFLAWVATAFVASPVLAMLAPGLEGLGTLLSVLVLPALAAAAVVHVFGGPFVVVGRDGIRIRRGGRTRFVPRAAIRAAFVDENGLFVLTRHHGEPLRLPVVGVPRARVNALVRRLEGAPSGAGAGERLAWQLARGGRSLVAWKKALGELVHQESGFRAAPIAVDDLAGVLADATAAPELRIAAALALRELEGPDATPRIRVAAETTAAAGVRLALERLAEEGELDEEELERLGAA